MTVDAEMFFPISAVRNTREIEDKTKLKICRQHQSRNQVEGSGQFQIPAILLCRILERMLLGFRQNWRSWWRREHFNFLRQKNAKRRNASSIHTELTTRELRRHSFLFITEIFFFLQYFLISFYKTTNFSLIFEVGS